MPQEAAIIDQQPLVTCSVVRDGTYLGLFEIDASGQVRVQLSDEHEQLRLEQLIQELGQEFGGNLLQGHADAKSAFFKGLQEEGYEIVSQDELDANLRGLLLRLTPAAREHLRYVLILDQADRDANSSALMRYRDQNGQDWADIIAS